MDANDEQQEKLQQAVEDGHVDGDGPDDVAEVIDFANVEGRGDGQLRA